MGLLVRWSVGAYVAATLLSAYSRAETSTSQYGVNNFPHFSQESALGNLSNIKGAAHILFPHLLAV